ncbi:MAG: hypothetical protein SGILL_002718 [Bacillariaceae sp.]
MTVMKTIEKHHAVGNILAKHLIFTRTKLPLNYDAQQQVRFIGQPADIFGNSSCGHQSRRDVFQALGLQCSPPMIVDSTVVVDTWHKYINDTAGDIPDRKLWLTFLLEGIFSRSATFREYLHFLKDKELLQDACECEQLLGLETVFNNFESSSLTDEPLIGNFRHFRSMIELTFADPTMFPAKAMRSAQRFFEEFAFGDIIKPFTIQHEDYAVPMRCHVLIGRSGMTISAMDDNSHLSRFSGSPMDVDNGDDDEEWIPKIKEKGEPFIAPLCPYDHECAVSPIKTHRDDQDEDAEWPYDIVDIVECDDMEEE